MTIVGAAIIGAEGPVVFVDDLERPEVDDETRHHLERVLRLRPGAPLALSDGRGRWRAGRLGPAIEPAGAVHETPAPTVEVAVAFAPAKGDRPEWVVQKLTEAGVDRIVPFLAARSVVRWEAERARRQVERWRRIAQEAAAQCRRARLPVVEELTDVGTLVAQGFVLADADGGPPTLATPRIAVGPEGGWDTDERAATARVALGSQVLRAETAAVAAGVLLGALRAGLVATVREDHTR